MLLRRARGDKLLATLALASTSDLAVRVRYLVDEIVDRSTSQSRRGLTYSLCVLLMMPLASFDLAIKPVEYRLVPIQLVDPTATANPAEKYAKPRRPQHPGVVPEQPAAPWLEVDKPAKPPPPY